MKQKVYRENLFIITLLIFSASLHFIYPISQPLPGDQFYQLKFGIKQPNINSNSGGTKLYALKGGYFYNKSSSHLYSRFYTKPINYIPTSFYWKLPIYESNDEFSVASHEDTHYLNIHLEEGNTLPIVSLVINPEDFFSYESGIYVRGKSAYEQKQNEFYAEPWNQMANFYKTGRASKRKVFFSIYNESGKHLYSTYCYARVSGHATRSFPQKSMTLSSSKLIGDKNFKTDLFKDGNYYDEFVLRNGGNDNTKALFRDAFMQSYMEKLGLFTSGKQNPYNVYINGEYWGIHFIQNKFTVNYVAKKLNVKKKKVTIVENWKLEDGSEKEYVDLMSFLKNEVKQKNISINRISDYFDLDDLTLYLAGEIFFANTDWPSNNIKLFKVSNASSEKSKWKFAFFDLDYGLGYTGNSAVEIDMFKFLNSKNDYLSVLFRKLMLFPDFKIKLFNQFKKFKELRNEDINEYYNLISPAIDMHTKRWRKPLNREEWQENVNEIKLFIERRYAVIENQIKDL